MILFIIFYLIGCILSYGRVLADQIGLEDYIQNTIYSDWSYNRKLNLDQKFLVWIVALTSWLGFVSGIIIYCRSRYKSSFIKFKFK